MAATRTVFIDTALSNYASLAEQYDTDLFNVVLLDGASPASAQIQDWLNSHPDSAGEINVVSASTSVTGLFTPRVVFIDPSVADLGTVIAGVPADATVVVLDAGRDGVQQIQDYLAANQGQVGAIDIMTDLASIDVVSHGSPGELMLGSTVLNAANLADYSSQLAAIGSHLTAGADLLLYGCDVASGTVGQEFISALAAATGADVAASSDLTGSAAAGGNWVLEASTGTIETAALNIAGYEGVLDAAISVFAVKLSADTGGSSSDFVTRTATQTITGSFNASTNGGAVPTIWVSTDGGGTRTQASIEYVGDSGAGTFSVTVNLLTGSNRTIQFFTASNPGNNQIPDSAQAYTLDTTPPTKTVNSLALSNDSGAVGSDFITNVASQTISGTLSANTAAGEVVRVSLDNGATWQTASNTVGQNTFSLSGVTLNGSGTLKVQVEDAAGNAGPARSQAYVLDTVAPAASVLTLRDLGDSGVPGDGITNDTSFLLDLPANDPASSLSFEVSRDGGAYSSTSSSQSNLADGNYQFRARVTDLAGNSTTTSTVSVTIDTTAPNAPSITGFTDNSGAGLDTLTKDTTPGITISAEADVTVEVFRDGDLVGTATQTAPHSGIYTFASSALADGSYGFTARAVDAAGNASAASAVQTIGIDTTLTAPELALAIDSGAAGDGLTNDASLSFNDADSDATRVIEVDNRVVDGYDAAALADGKHTVKVTDTDGAGNTKSTSLSFTLDTALTAPTVALASDGGAAGDGLTNNASLGFNDADSDATRVIEVDNRVVDAYDAAALADGKHTVKVTDTDGAGNTKSTSLSFTLDTALTAPTMALVNDSGAKDDGLTNDARLSFNDADGDAQRVIEVDGEVVAAYDASSLADGSHTVKVTDTDGAGNTRTATSTFTLDGAGPVFTSGASASIAENAGDNQIVYWAQSTDAHAVGYALGGKDAARFDISAAGVVTLKDNPNFEAINAYQFTVLATDAAGNRSDQAVNLSVSNVNEGPVACPVSMSTLENTAISFLLADYMSDPDAGDKLAFALKADSVTLSWANTDLNAATKLINPVTRTAVELSSLNVKASLSADGTSVLLTPPAELDWMATGQAVKATFTYTVTDTGGLTSTDSITLTMTGSTSDKGYTLSGGNGNDTLAGNATNNAEDLLQGGNGNDILTGHGGTDALYGGNGDDKLSGGIGIDYLYGDSGNDTLDGGSEGDFLFGGKGSDSLTGGTGADKFVFEPQGGGDRILDFKVTEGDKLFFADFFSTMTAKDFISQYVTDTGSDLVINLQGTSITLVGVASADMLSNAIGFGMPT